MIRYHASHEEEDVKCALFVRMLGRLKSLMENDPPLYGTILKVIESIPDSSVAKNGAAQHHLHSVVRHTPGKGKQPKTLDSVVYAFLVSRANYTEDANELLNFRRNGHTHLISHHGMNRGSRLLNGYPRVY